MIDRFEVREVGIPLAEFDVTTQALPVMEAPADADHAREMLRMVRALRPGKLVIDASFMPGLSTDKQTAELIEIEDHAKTRRASRHELVFGQLVLNGSDQAENSLHVATKSLDDTMLAHEYAWTGHIAAGYMGHLDTFRPVGLARFHDGQAAMVTLYHHPVRSLDNVFANPALIDEDAVVNTALGWAGKAMATTHAHDLVIVDTQTKNSLVDLARKHEKVAFSGDFESAKDVGRLRQGERDQHKINDITTFVASAHELEGKGCELPEDYDDRIARIFGGAYLRRLAEIGMRSATDIDQSLIGYVVGQSPRLENGQITHQAS